MLTASKQWKQIPIDELQEAPWNYKAEDERMEQALINNMKRNGQIVNLIVRTIGKDRYEVVNGNHRLRALRALGAKTALCFDLGEIDTATAKRIALETNEVSFAPNQEALTVVLKTIIDKYGLKDVAETTPFSVVELRDRLEFFDYLARMSDPNIIFATEHFQPKGVDPPALTLSIEGLTEAEMRLVQKAFDATREPMDGEALLAICRTVGRRDGNEEEEIADGDGPEQEHQDG